MGLIALLLFNSNFVLFLSVLLKVGIKIKQYYTFLSFGLVFIYIAFYVFIFRDLQHNKISQLPENVFSGLSSLSWL